VNSGLPAGGARASACTSAGLRVRELDAVDEDGGLRRREGRKRQQGGARESDEVEEDEIVTVAAEGAPELPHEARLAPSREPLLSRARGRGGVRGVIEQHHAIDASEPARLDALVEGARDAAIHARNAAIDAQPGQAEQDRTPLSHHGDLRTLATRCGR
jgi:hypothetical protein